MTNRHAEVAALSFPEALALIGESTGRSLQFDGTPEAYRAEMGRAGLPEEVIEGLIENFQRLAARGDTRPTGVVEAVLGAASPGLRGLRRRGRHARSMALTPGVSRA